MSPTFSRVDALPGSALRHAREALKISPEEAAKRLGFSVITTGITQITRWEKAGPGFKPRSHLYWDYVEMLGLRAPGPDAGLLAVAEAIGRLDATLARVLAIVEAHDAAFTKDGRWLAVLAPGQTVQVDEVQLRSAADESVRRLYAEGEAEARKDAL